MIINILRSTRLAQGLIISLLLVMLLSIFIPQKALFTEAEIAAFARSHPVVWKAAAAFSLTDIYRSPLFIVLASALSLNLTYCIGRRAVRIFLPELVQIAPPPSGGPAPEKTALRRRPDIALGVKLRFAGSTLFHIGILVVMAGLLASETAGFLGSAVVTEGQTLIDRHDSYGSPKEGPLFFEGHDLFSVKLDRIYRTFSQKGDIIRLETEVTVKDGKSRFRRRIRVNHPLEHSGAVFVLKEDGYSPMFTLRDKKTGGKIFSSYVNLTTFAKCTNDSFAIPAAGLRVETGFSSLRKNKRAAAQRKPSFGAGGEMLFARVVQTAKTSGGREKVLYSGPLFPGKSVSAGAHELSVDDVRSWVRFKVTRDPGKEVVFIGFWMCAAGLVLRFYCGGSAAEKKTDNSDKASEAAKAAGSGGAGAPRPEKINA